MSSEENVKQDNQQLRGQKGEVGKATAGGSIKARHRAEGRGLSLKVFARKLAKDGDEVAEQWFANKLGAANQSRSDKNIAAASASSTATKAAKRKKKGDGK